LGWGMLVARCPNTAHRSQILISLMELVGLVVVARQRKKTATREGVFAQSRNLGAS